MSTRTRSGIVITMALAGAITLVLAGCGRQGQLGTTQEFTTVSTEGQALESMGFAPEDVLPGATEQDTTSTPAPSPGQQRHPLRRFARLRAAFGRHLLHGEFVVQTQDGTKTLVVQRGTVTAVSATSLTVKSADGFTLTWTVGSPLHVVVNRVQAHFSAIAVGATVGVAGVKESGTPTARLIVEPKTS
jgi:hypothetical protein